MEFKSGFRCRQEQHDNDKSTEEGNWKVMGFPSNRLTTMMCVYYSGTILDWTTEATNAPRLWWM